MQSPPQRRWNFPALNSGANGMADYYYQDAQGQLRGPSTLPVLLALKELGLITAQTLVQDGSDGFPFPFSDLEPKTVAVKTQTLPTPLPVASFNIPTVDRWGCIARTYFTLAQCACFVAAVLFPIQTMMQFPDYAGRPDDLRRCLGLVFLAFACLLEFSFFSALFFVFAYVKRRGLGTD